MASLNINQQKFVSILFISECFQLIILYDTFLFLIILQILRYSTMLHFHLNSAYHSQIKSNLSFFLLISDLYMFLKAQLHLMPQILPNYYILPVLI